MNLVLRLLQCLAVGIWLAGFSTQLQADDKTIAALLGFGVEGMSLQRSSEDLIAELGKRGYALKKQKSRKGVTTYDYRKGIKKALSRVSLVVRDDNASVQSIKIELPVSGDQDSIDAALEQFRQLLLVQAGLCNIRKLKVNCTDYTDTNEIKLTAVFSQQRLKYEFSNKASRKAQQRNNRQRKMAEQAKRRDALAQERIAAQEARALQIAAQQQRAAEAEEAKIRELDELEKTLPPGASGYGRYTSLEAVVQTENREFCRASGKFLDQGYRSEMFRCGERQPDGYWVWFEPNWYLWQRSLKSVEDLMQAQLQRLAALPVTDASLKQLDAAVESVIRQKSIRDNGHELEGVSAERIAEHVDSIRALGKKKASDQVNIVKLELENRFQAYPQNGAGLVIFYQDILAAIRAETFSVANAEQGVNFSKTILTNALAEMTQQTAGALVEKSVEIALKQLARLENSQFEKIEVFKAIRRPIDFINFRLSSDQQWNYNDLIDQFNVAYEAAFDAMIARSLPKLLKWIDAYPPSMTMLRSLSGLQDRLFDIEGPEVHRFAALRKAINEKKAQWNTEGYQRPDIILTLMNGYWHEIALYGLDNVAYHATLLRKLGQRCAGSVDAGDSRLAGFIQAGLLHAKKEYLKGATRSRADAERGNSLMVVALLGRPGCLVDAYGNVSNCTTVEESEAMKTEVMTSAEAISDVEKFIEKNGCSSNAMNTLLENYVTLAGKTPYWYDLTMSAEFVVPRFPFLIEVVPPPPELSAYYSVLHRRLKETFEFTQKTGHYQEYTDPARLMTTARSHERKITETARPRKPYMDAEQKPFWAAKGELSRILAIEAYEILIRKFPDTKQSAEAGPRLKVLQSQ